MPTAEFSVPALTSGRPSEYSQPVNAKLLPQPKYLLTFLPESPESPEPVFDDVLIEWGSDGWLLTSDMHEVMIPHEGVGLLIEALRSREDDSFFNGWSQKDDSFSEWFDASHPCFGITANLSPGETRQWAPEQLDPNAIAPGHNPNKLTNDVVGVVEGWRLLGAEEVDSTLRYYPGTEWWSCSQWAPAKASPYCTVTPGLSTLRTKNPPGFYRIEGGAK